MIEFITPEKPSKPLCLILGNMDGVHLGHQALIEKAVFLAKQNNGEAGLMRLTPHPIDFFGGRDASWMIQSTEQTIKLLRFYGVNHLLSFPFNERTSRLSPAEFLDFVLENTNISHLIVGDNFRFGRDRQGDPEMLRELASELGISVHVCSHVEDDRGVLSSTRVRKCIVNGDMKTAGQLLGRPFFVEGSVVRGIQKGREIGAPTANIEPKDLLWPMNGVYATWTKARDQWFPSISNIGMRPTRDAPTLGLETHLLDVDLDLYTSEILIAFTELLREERIFSDFLELEAQIALDIKRRKQLPDFMEKPEFGPLDLF